jgi:cell division septation protein DedD
MNHLLEPELDREAAGYSDDREISLGPGTILGIFFVLALVCACFFGFGYSVGRRSAQSATVQPAVIHTTSVIPAANKPAAGSAAPPAPVVTETETPAIPAAATIGTEKPSPTPPPSPAVPAAAAILGNFMVQVAAVSSQDIADIEVAALKKDGYAVVVRHEPQDKLLHVQIGPFADKNAAEAMRKRVQADGFNAIVK